VRAARVRLASLWVSQTARVLADWCLRVAAVLQTAHAGRAPLQSAWHLATVVFITPFILLAPLNGVLCNGLPRRRVLVASAAWSLVAVAAGALGVRWLVCLGLAALGAAVYSPARFAVLPAAAADARLPLPRVNGWVELGAAAAIVGGVLLGVETGGGEGPVLAVLLGLDALCLLTALPAHFPSDVVRPEPWGRAAVDFFRDARRVLRDRPAAASLLGLAAFQAVVTAGAGALLTIALDRHDLDQLLQALVLTGGGAAFGCALASLQAHPRRNLGFVPLGATGLLLALAWAGAASGEGIPQLPCLLLGCFGGLVNVPLRSAYLAAVPADARGNAMSVMNTAIYVLTSLAAVALFGLTRGGLVPTPAAQLGALAALAAAGAAAAWRVLFPQALELVIEWVVWPLYRIRAYGPGLELLPRSGPLLVVANHSSYLDPFWLAKHFPRPMRPMMTSRFYDLPLVRWLMTHVVRAIRVQEAGFRRAAPELLEAVSALRAGDCLLVFPEAILRRSEGQLLRPFGQGVWHVLRELPDTAVVVCWIEGGWGSYFSYKDGPPGKNKRMDWWRRVDIAYDAPRALPPEVLADQRATRAYLHQAVLDCRSYLGLKATSSE
jgi:1-acyl-sn-glycerol-3-phosphate acyltransferase